MDPHYPPPEKIDHAELSELYTIAINALTQIKDYLEDDSYFENIERSFIAATVYEAYGRIERRLDFLEQNSDEWIKM